MTSVHAPPGFPPPSLTSTSNSHSSQPHLPVDEDDIPITEPPPAYTPYPNVVNSSTEQTLAVGPTRMDFSGPPPLPQHVEEEMRRQTSSSTNRITSNPTGGSGSRFPAPPSHPSLSPRQPSSTFAPPPHPPPPPPPPPPPLRSPASSFSRGTFTTPTETPWPGRPLLHKGKFLIYPVGFTCNKCEFLMEGPSEKAIS